MTLSRAHFQLTGRCNLKCAFCGQAKGMLACDPAKELPLAKWLSLADELKACAGAETPKITLWGGEPLLWGDFDALARELSARKIELSVVTNGTLIDRHAQVLSECFAEIFVSVDGCGSIHDQSRGEGVFAKLEHHLPLLKNRCGELIFMTTVSDVNVKILPDLPLELAYLHPDRMILSQLMYVSQTDFDEYQQMARELDQPLYPELSAWIRGDDRQYLSDLKAALTIMANKTYPMPVVFTPHHYPETAFTGAVCPAMDHRVHIRHDGNVSFCTDYFGFQLGNVKQMSLRDIFYGETAQKIRDYCKLHRLPVCNHCPWLGQSL